MIKNEDLPVEYVILRDYLKANLNAKIAAGGKECVIRCPFCGDSKDPRSAHLYVGLNRKGGGTICYNCFKCNHNGPVNIHFFRALNIYDSDVVNAVLQYNTNHGSNIYAENVDRTFMTNKHNPVTENSIIPVRNTPEYLKKLDYINRRIGANLTLNDLDGYKIILNLKDYLAANGITTYSRDPRIMDQLAFGFIGFLSVDSTHVTLRRIISEDKVHETIRNRYTNYTINEKGSQIYCIREGIDIYQPNQICIAEGCFDCLSIHYNMMYWMMNKIIFASCGKGLATVLKYLIFNKGMDMLNSTIHLFIDNDITPRDMINNRMILNSLGVPYVIHRNGFEDEKDFGVPGNRIIDTVL